MGGTGVQWGTQVTGLPKPKKISFEDTTEDAWVDAEAVRRFGIKLEDPEGGPGRRAIWQGHPS